MKCGPFPRPIGALFGDCHHDQIIFLHELEAWHSASKLMQDNISGNLSSDQFAAGYPFQIDLKASGNAHRAWPTCRRRRRRRPGGTGKSGRLVPFFFPVFLFAYV